MRVPVLLGTALAAMVAATGSTGATTTTAPVRPASGNPAVYVDTAASPTLSVSVVVPLATTTPPKLLENGIPVKLESASNVGEAKSTAIIVDHSQSMHGEALRNAVAAARQLLTHRRPGDRIAVYSAASKALRLTGFSTSPAAGIRALEGIRLDKVYGTRDYDAVLMAVADLKRQPGPGKLVLLVTDGQDTTSRAGIAETAAAASSAGVKVYPVAISSATYLPNTLLRLARATSGAFFGTGTRSSATASAGIASDIRRTWQLTYSTPADQGATLNLEIVQPHAKPLSATATLPGTPPGHSSLAENGVIGLVILLLIGVIVIIYRTVNPKRT
jgi:von Willebrand factor type A domain